MVTPKIYIDANAPTVAEGAIRGAYWYGVNPYQTIEKALTTPRNTPYRRKNTGTQSCIIWNLPLLPRKGLQS